MFLSTSCMPFSILCSTLWVKKRDSGFFLKPMRFLAPEYRVTRPEEKNRCTQKTTSYFSLRILSHKSHSLRYFLSVLFHTHRVLMKGWLVKSCWFGLLSKRSIWALGNLWCNFSNSEVTRITSPMEAVCITNIFSIVIRKKPLLFDWETAFVFYVFVLFNY